MDWIPRLVLLVLGAFPLLTLTLRVSLHKQNVGFQNKTGPGQAALVGYAYPKAPPEFAAQFTWTATATHYSSSQAGTRICPNYDYHCGAPSDGSDFWDGGICTCDGSDRTCSHGYCYDCNGANQCMSECPHCPQTMCGRQFKITCIDPYRRGYCTTSTPVIMTVTNACPQYNPCNTCKSPNPCRGGYNHIDLCDATFSAIADPSKQPEEGIMIGVDSY